MWLKLKHLLRDNLISEVTDNNHKYEIKFHCSCAILLMLCRTDPFMKNSEIIEKSSKLHVNGRVSMICARENSIILKEGTSARHLGVHHFSCQ